MLDAATHPSAADMAAVAARPGAIGLLVTHPPIDQHTDTGVAGRLTLKMLEDEPIHEREESQRSGAARPLQGFPSSSWYVTVK